MNTRHRYLSRGTYVSDRLQGDRSEIDRQDREAVIVIVVVVVLLVLVDW